MRLCSCLVVFMFFVLHPICVSYFVPAVAALKCFINQIELRWNKHLRSSHTWYLGDRAWSRVAHKPSTPSALSQPYKTPHSTLIIISRWELGNPRAPPSPFNESCIPSSHVASCTVLNWATVSKNGEVAQRLFVHENCCVQSESAQRKWHYCR